MSGYGAPEIFCGQGKCCPAPRVVAGPEGVRCAACGTAYCCASPSPTQTVGGIVCQACGTVLGPCYDCGEERDIDNAGIRHSAPPSFLRSTTIPVTRQDPAQIRRIAFIDANNSAGEKRRLRIWFILEQCRAPPLELPVRVLNEAMRITLDQLRRLRARGGCSPPAKLLPFVGMGLYLACQARHLPRTGEEIARALQIDVAEFWAARYRFVDYKGGIYSSTTPEARRRAIEVVCNKALHCRLPAAAFRALAARALAVSDELNRGLAFVPMKNRVFAAIALVFANNDLGAPATRAEISKIAGIQVPTIRSKIQAILTHPNVPIAIKFRLRPDIRPIYDRICQVHRDFAGVPAVTVWGWVVTLPQQLADEVLPVAIGIACRVGGAPGPTPAELQGCGILPGDLATQVQGILARVRRQDPHRFAAGLERQYLLP